MKVATTGLPGVLVLEPAVFEDERGYFMESWNARTFLRETGVEATFVQDNHSRSTRNTLRGIHYQFDEPQAKLVRVVVGAVFDVAVDLRRSSPSFGRWTGVQLTAENRLQLWIPAGFGHAYIVLSDVAEVVYKATAFWNAMGDRAIAWNDPQIAIDWPTGLHPVLSARDSAAPTLARATVYD